MADKQLVLAFFDSEAAADGAVSALKAWDKATKEIKLGGVGILVKDDKGQIKTHKKDDLARIDGELNGGKAAVCILAEPAEAEAVAAKLAELSGKPETHEVTEAAVAEATEATEAAPEAKEPEEMAPAAG